MSWLLLSTAAMNTGMDTRCLFELRLLQGISPVVGLLGHMVNYVGAKI